MSLQKTLGGIKMKKVFAFFLAMLMITTFAGCGENNSHDNVVEIEFYMQNESELEIFEKIVSDFNAEHPEIKVTMVNLPEEESGNVLNTRIQNNDSPDIYNEWFSQDAFNKIDAGAVLDMTGSKYCSYINDDVLEQTAYNGKNYLLPMTCNFMGVYYNVDMFNQYGIEVPKTLDEFWQVCEAFQAKGVTPISAGDKDGWNLAHWVQDVIGVYMPNYSDDFLKIFDKQMTFADAEGISDVAEIVINRTKYVQNGCLGDGTSEMISHFVNKETAMMINGSWQMAKLNAADLDFEYAVFPFPAKNVEDTTVMSNADFSFMLSAQSSLEKQEASKVFLEYVLSEGAKYYIEQSGSPSALKDIKPDTHNYQAIVPYMDGGKIFRMPYSGRWTDDTYLDYTVALQNLVDSSNKETFYKEFTDALLISGKPATYVD